MLQTPNINVALFTLFGGLTVTFALLSAGVNHPRVNKASPLSSHSVRLACTASTFARCFARGKPQCLLQRSAMLCQACLLELPGCLYVPVVCT